MAKDTSIMIEEIEFVLITKPIKNLYIRVKKDGKAHVSVPKHLSQKHLHAVLSSYLPWVKAQLLKLSTLPEAQVVSYITGETHYLWGKPYILQWEKQHKRAQAILQEDKIILQSKDELSMAERMKLLDQLYRSEIESIMPALITQWENRMQVQSSQWRLKKMKTRWGTCNTQAKRIWLNTELAKYPLECFEYVLVHELVHLLERSHNHRFKAFMTEFLPDWQSRKTTLNQLAMKMY